MSPLGKSAAVLLYECMQHKRGKRELVDHVRFITPIPKIGDVVIVGHVGFCNDLRGWICQFSNGSEELYNTMGLIQVDAGCTDFFPEIPHRI